MQQKAFKSQWAQRHLKVPEKVVGTKKWCNSGNILSMAFKSRRLGLVLSDTKTIELHGVLSKLQCNCGSNKAERSLLQPCLKVRRNFSSLSTNLTMTRTQKSLHLPSSQQLAWVSLHRVARMREKDMMTERVVWPTPNTRASSGAMSFPATRYTPATAAPDVEKTHTSPDSTNTAVCHSLLPRPQCSLRTNTSLVIFFIYQWNIFCTNIVSVWIYQKMVVRSHVWLHAACRDILQCTATFCVDFLQESAMLILTICCLGHCHGNRQPQRNFLWMSNPRTKAEIYTLRNLPWADEMRRSDRFLVCSWWKLSVFLFTSQDLGVFQIYHLYLKFITFSFLSIFNQLGYTHTVHSVN